MDQTQVLNHRPHVKSPGIVVFLFVGAGWWTTIMDELFPTCAPPPPARTPQLPSNVDSHRTEFQSYSFQPLDGLSRSKGKGPAPVLVSSKGHCFARPAGHAACPALDRGQLKSLRQRVWLPCANSAGCCAAAESVRCISAGLSTVAFLLPMAGRRSDSRRLLAQGRLCTCATS